MTKVPFLLRNQPQINLQARLTQNYIFFRKGKGRNRGGKERKGKERKGKERKRKGKE